MTSVFNRRDWTDTIAYGLPGANLVAGGGLALPQLGAQMSFGRYWLFNAPFIVLATVPAFLVTGIGRVPYLSAVVAFGMMNLAVFSTACRRLLRLESWSLAIVLAYGLLGTRAGITADLYNQRYALCAFSLVLIAFYPVRDASGVPRWWQWLIAALLPFIHVALIPVTGLWLLMAIWRWRTQRSLAGPLVFAAAAVPSVAWYARPAAITSQLLPHIAYGGYRSGGHLAGLLATVASRPGSIPAWTLNIAIVAGALAVLIGWVRQEESRRLVAPAIPAAVVIAAGFAVDALRGFTYYTYVLLGLGPILLAVAGQTRARRPVIAGLFLLAALNVAVAWRLELWHPDWTTTPQADAFVTAHTQPADRLVLGPPFVFSAATLRPLRDVHRVVPQPYFLEAFDGAAWARELQACCDVYVGDERWFRTLVDERPAGAPMFADASVDRLDFRGQAVIVARRAH